MNNPLRILRLAFALARVPDVPEIQALLLPLFRLPLRPNLLRKLGRCAHISPGKIHHEGAGDDRHLDDLKFIVGADKLRNVESQDFGDPLHYSATRTPLAPAERTPWPDAP